MKLYIKYILRPKSIIVWIILFALLILIYTYYNYYLSNDLDIEINDDLNEPSVTDTVGYLIYTPGCRIPEMYVHGPLVDKYMNYRDQINCESGQLILPLVTSNLTSLTLNMSAFATLNIKRDDQAFQCYYTPIKRSNLKNIHNYNENDLELGEKVYFKYSITVLDEMVEVKCTLHNQVIYHNYHIFIRPKESVLKRQNGNVSILILGLDSVSRMNFRRQMPKSDTILSQLGNIEMLGYNKIDDNTYPNLISVLSGMSAEELKDACLSNNYNFFDKCNFVWDKFKNANFGTAFVEDSPVIGLFNYLRKGFIYDPTDHYLRPLMLQAERSLGHSTGNNGNTLLCIGAKLSLATVLDHTLKIARSMADRLYMNFAWSTSLTHDNVENPYYGDDDLSKFLVALNMSGALNYTVLIVMSDHGMRWGQFRSTYQGGLEERLPMLRFVIPEWFRKRYRKALRNLKKNTRRLTTPYDFHETLLDLIQVQTSLDDDTIANRSEKKSDLKDSTSAMSLFLEVSENKTCQSARIPVHYCACHGPRKTLSVNDGDAIYAAKVMLQQINSILTRFPLCAKLKLLHIDTAAVEIGMQTKVVKDYELQVTTEPGLAKLEATVRDNDNNFTLIGSVSRLNMYGNQSSCINDPKIKLICYCINTK